MSEISTIIQLTPLEFDDRQRDHLDLGGIRINCNKLKNFAATMRPAAEETGNIIIGSYSSVDYNNWETIGQYYIPIIKLNAKEIWGIMHLNSSNISNWDADMILGYHYIQSVRINFDEWIVDLNCLEMFFEARPGVLVNNTQLYMTNGTIKFIRSDNVLMDSNNNLACSDFNGNCQYFMAHCSGDVKIKNVDVRIYTYNEDRVHFISTYFYASDDIKNQPKYPNIFYFTNVEIGWSSIPIWSNGKAISGINPVNIFARYMIPVGFYSGSPYASIDGTVLRVSNVFNGYTYEFRNDEGIFDDHFNIY